MPLGLHGGRILFCNGAYRAFAAVFSLAFGAFSYAGPIETTPFTDAGRQSQAFAPSFSIPQDDSVATPTASESIDAWKVANLAAAAVDPSLTVAPGALPRPSLTIVEPYAGTTPTSSSMAVVASDSASARLTTFLSEYWFEVGVGTIVAIGSVWVCIRDPRARQQ